MSKTPFSDIIQRQLSALRQFPDRWRTEATSIALPAVQNAWPRVAPRWRYATGESLAGWAATDGEGASITVWNDVEHTFYTESGYTRAGEGTARSYDGTPYSLTAIQGCDVALYQMTDRLMTEVWNA